MTVLEMNPMARTTDSPPRALVTLSHPSDRRTAEDALSRHGFTVRTTDDRRAATALLVTYSPDVVVIDAREVYPRPTDLADAVRRHHDVGTIAVGANSDRQRIVSLENGADDVVSTEVSAEEIALRCRSLTGRLRKALPIDDAPTAIMEFGTLRVDPARREVRVRGYEVPATRLEFDLLCRICRTPHEVVSRVDLMEAVWGPNWFGDTHVVDVHLSNLRRKLRGRDPGQQFWTTVRGIGFRLTDELALGHGTSSLQRITRRSA